MKDQADDTALQEAIKKSFMTVVQVSHAQPGMCFEENASFGDLPLYSTTASSGKYYIRINRSSAQFKLSSINIL
jgi:hypothetical protein